MKPKVFKQKNGTWIAMWRDTQIGTKTTSGFVPYDDWRSALCCIAFSAYGQKLNSSFERIA